MARRADPARIHEARRAARIARLRDVSRWPEDAAEAAVTAWEVQADAEGRQRGSTAFWDGFDDWAAERRRER